MEGNYITTQSNPLYTVYILSHPIQEGKGKREKGKVTTGEKTEAGRIGEMRMYTVGFFFFQKKF